MFKHKNYKRNLNNKKKNKATKYKGNIVYIIMLVAGFLATFSYVGTIWASNAGDIILNIFAMLGSGIFCSGIVSLIVEKAGKKRQREFLLFKFVGILSILIREELLYLSSLYVLDIKEENKETVEVDISYKEAVNKILSYLGELIKKEPEETKQAPTSPKFTVQYGKMKDAYGYGHTLSYYNSLIVALSELTANESLFLIEGVFTEDEINALYGLQNFINPIKMSSEMGNYLTTLERKKFFYNQLQDKCQFLNSFFRQIEKFDIMKEKHGQAETI